MAFLHRYKPQLHNSFITTSPQQRDATPSMVRPLLARRLTPSSPPLRTACLCLLFGGAHAAKPLFTPFTLINAGQAGEKADAERGLFDGSARGREGPYMGVPRADLNITRGVDFEGKGSSMQTVFKLKQLRVSVIVLFVTKAP